jgi:uncharacterized membrane protein YidH (DUF202 family)
MENVAIIIFAIGILLTAYATINLVTTKKVVDFSQLKRKTDKSNYYAWSHLIGVFLLILGSCFFFSLTN